MIETEGRALFLKTFFEDDVDRWGVLALPRQTGVTALRLYNPGDLVLVAQSGRALRENGPGGRGGRVFAVCTLSGQQGGTRDLANPTVLEEWAADIDRWRDCVVIDRYWRIINPRHFKEFQSDGLVKCSGGLRGKLGLLDHDPELDKELRDWLQSAGVEEQEVWRPRSNLAAESPA